MSPVPSLNRSITFSYLTLLHLLRSYRTKQTSRHKCLGKFTETKLYSQRILQYYTYVFYLSVSGNLFKDTQTIKLKQGETGQIHNLNYPLPYPNSINVTVQLEVQIHSLILPEGAAKNWPPRESAKRK